MSDIFEAIWNHPASHVSVSRRGPDGQFINPDADILLEEGPSQGGDCIGEDNAPRPLFHQVNDSLFAQPTFQTFTALLNNYTAIEGREERPLSHPEHGVEVDAFVGAVLATEPMRMAFEYVRENLRPSLCEETFRDLVRKVWFEPFTNNFSGTERFCVGFEHVFVGEDSSRANSAPRCGDSVGGYHSWIKCYLDEKSGRVNYLGHDYPSSIAQQGLADPHIATVIMTWTPSAEEGGHGHMLLKKPGGFFVGTRPECEIALGTVGLLSVLANQFDNTSQAGTENHRRVKLGDSFFDLVLHPQTIIPRRNGNPAQLGEHIRTMYAKFRGSPDVPSDGDGDDVTPPTQPHNNAAIRIVRALPNPPGLADQGEWVELENVSTFDFELSEWQLSDEEGRVQRMSGALLPGQTLQIALTRDNDQPMMLRNRGGWILLFQGNVRRAAVQYPEADQGEIFAFD